MVHHHEILEPVVVDYISSAQREREVSEFTESFMKDTMPSPHEFLTLFKNKLWTSGLPEVQKNGEFVQAYQVVESGIKLYSSVFNTSQETGIQIDGFDENNTDSIYSASIHNNSGLIELNVALVRKNNQGEAVRHPLLPQFIDLFGLTLELFSAMKVDVLGIQDNWYSGTNRDIYESNLLAMNSRAEAALLTPTGKVASKHRFTRASFLDGETDNGVHVLFLREFSPSHIL